MTIHCLMNTGEPLPESVSRLLFETAKRMANNAKKKLKFQNDLCVGVLTTGWKTSSMGTLSGTEFKAEMMLGKKETVVTFIVHSNWLEQDPELGNWTWGPTDQMERFIAQDAMSERPRRLN